ncbi:outer membrane beta-barrel protein [Vibrio mexicanus]|uniref:outer membrane beta-barrel protein n=1 Tax=Vibrio mexicanus TaxID=1004326 RepID=UPI00063CD126|nr:outer membrane beta-barrel protein [Vibrio mexicanus]
MRHIYLVITSLLAVFSFQAHAAFYVAPQVGFTAGGSVENQEGTEYDIEASESYAIALETDFDKGRIGLFYATQSSKVETLNTKSSMHYLQFQSSIYYPIQQNVSTFLGIGLGGSYADVEWASDKYGFSASIFGGVEYQVSESVFLTSQVRWLGTVVDNETTGICNLPSSTEQCIIRFKTDWMNQFSANLGLNFKF